MGCHAERLAFYVSNCLVEFHLIHSSCLGHWFLLASVEADLVHLDLGISASSDYVVTGLGLELHPLQVGWWFGGLEHEHLLVGPREEF